MSDSECSKQKPHLWCHTCSGTQASLCSGFKKSSNRAVEYTTVHSLECLVHAQGGSCRKCWHHKMLLGQHEDWAGSPVSLRTRRQERGTAGSCYVHMHQPPPPWLLKDENSLPTSGTGVAVTACIALSGATSGRIYVSAGVFFQRQLKAVRQKLKGSTQVCKGPSKHVSGSHPFLSSGGEAWETSVPP